MLVSEPEGTSSGDGDMWHNGGATCFVGHAVSALLDLHKAYEHVTHGHLLSQAVRFGFNLKLLRFIVILYSMHRVVMVGSVVTRLVRAHRLVRAVPGVQVSGAVSRAAVARWCAASLHHVLHLPAARANGCEGLCHCSR